MNKITLIIMTMIITSNSISASYLVTPRSQEEQMKIIFKLANNPSLLRTTINNNSKAINYAEKIQASYPSAEIARIIQLQKDEVKLTTLIANNARQYKDEKNQELQSLLTEYTTIANESISLMPEFERLAKKYESSWCTIS